MLHFSEVEIAKACEALTVLAEVIVDPDAPTPSQLSASVKIKLLMEHLAASQFTLSDGDLSNICLGLTILLDENPLDFRANSLLVRLTPICGFIRPNL